jgi:1-acyl-sn-glycerol-3-phosphate acyltransferase
MSEARPSSYDELVSRARTLYPGVRIGRPGKSRRYYPMIAAMRVLRVRFAVRVIDAQKVVKGPAILIGNHISGWDPVMVVIATWWRCSAFTKIEVFERPGAVFFRIMGQIPLRRGDDASTDWAMQVSRHALDHGGKVAIYPEGTRSPYPEVMHRLHKRILVPLLQANPETPVHVVAIGYQPRGWRRTKVTIRVSEPLELDPRTMGPDELTDRVRDAMLALSGQRYSDRYARDVKAELRQARRAAAADPGGDG